MERVERTLYEPHEIAWTPERVANLWRSFATNPSYDNTYFSMHSGASVLQFLRGYVSLESRHVLDFGCGRGHMLEHLIDQSVACRGLEFSEESAAATEARLGERPNFDGVIRAQNLPTALQNKTEDVVLLIEVVEHLFDEQLVPTMREAYRILRPGGYVIATTPHTEDLVANMMHCPDCGATFHRWQHMRSVTPTALSGWMREAGFLEVVCRPIYFRPQATIFGRLYQKLYSGYRRLRGDNPQFPHLIFIGQKSEF